MLVHSILDSIYKSEILNLFFDCIRVFSSGLTIRTLNAIVNLQSELVHTSSRFMNQLITCNGLQVLDHLGIFSGEVINETSKLTQKTNPNTYPEDSDVLVSGLQMASHMARISDSGPSYDSLEVIFTPDKLIWLLSQDNPIVM